MGCKSTETGCVSCPFHEDRHPSMKLNERYFYCFGCGATGDVIDLVARLFDLSSYEAAQKLAQDFGIGPDKPPAATRPAQTGASSAESIPAGGSALPAGAV